MLLKNEGEANLGRIISLRTLFVREIECAVVVIGKGNIRLAVIFYNNGVDMFSTVSTDSDTYISRRNLLMQYTFREK